MGKLLKGMNPSENQRLVLERLREVAAMPNIDVAGLVIKSMLAEPKERKISNPARCVMLACSRPEEEDARWRGGLPKGSSERSIEAARNVVNHYLGQLNFAKNWEEMDTKAEAQRKEAG